MLSGICSAGVSRICKGAERRLCRACPLYSKFTGQAPQYTPDIEDLGLGGVANVTRRHAARRRGGGGLPTSPQRVIAVESTVEHRSQASTTIKLATTMGLETDGPPDFKAPHPFPLKAQRRMMSTTPASLQRATHRRGVAPAPLKLRRTDDAQDDVVVAPVAAPAVPAPAATAAPAAAPSPQIVSFSSTEGKAMFRESMAEGYQESYFRLAEQFQTECDGGSGMGSLAMVLNALQVDPLQSAVVETPVWKGIWRWFSSDMLARNAEATGCSRAAPSDAEAAGPPKKPAAVQDLTEFACFARRALSSEKDRTVASFQTSHTDITAFRIHVKYTVSSPNTFLVACFDREAVRGGSKQQASEYSPVAGYHAASDSVLILDVDRLNATPYWVPLARLYENMKAGGYCIFRKEAADEAEDRRDIARFIETLYGSVLDDKQLTAALSVRQDLHDDATLREVLTASQTYAQISSVCGDGAQRRDLPVLAALLLATPCDILMQALPEKQQASLWWMKRTDSLKLQTWLPKWSKQLAWLADGDAHHSGSLGTRCYPSIPVSIPVSGG